MSCYSSGTLPHHNEWWVRSRDRDRLATFIIHVKLVQQQLKFAMYFRFVTKPEQVFQTYSREEEEEDQFEFSILVIIKNK